MTSSSKTIDLNIFYREDWNAETEETTWSSTLTIDPYIYETDGYGTRKYELHQLIECTPTETKQIALHYPEAEYGSDWWDFVENFLPFAPPRIASLLKAIDVDRINQEPSWWVTMTDDMLI